VTHQGKHGFDVAAYTQTDSSGSSTRPGRSLMSTIHLFIDSSRIICVVWIARNCRTSVCLSVRPIVWPQRRVCCFGPGSKNISINCCTAGAHASSVTLSTDVASRTQTCLSLNRTLQSVNWSCRCERERADKRERRSRDQLHCLGLRRGTRLVPERNACRPHPASRHGHSRYVG